jgi:2-polyprenyl-3-methyl-5-hydroxy-6-metoxy-1,4-benzoquinol methylase
MTIAGREVEEDSLIFRRFVVEPVSGLSLCDTVSHANHTEEGIAMATTQDHPEFDAAKADAFAEHLLAALNAGALCLMASVGHRTGLFDTMRDLPPSTSAEIAAAAHLHERYVREWLGAMVMARVIDVDSTSTHYRLPAEHAAFLTRAAAADNLAVFTQYIAVLGAVEDDIVACFQQGGGVPYEEYPRFHAVMAEDSGLSVLSSLEAHILPLVPGLTERLALGIHVLDVGCGSGYILNRLAERYPNSQFTGIDLSAEAIAAARSNAAQNGLKNVAFHIQDLSDFDDTAAPEAFDFVTTFDAIHDQAQPLNVLKGIHRALTADGVYLMQDIRGSSHVYQDIGHPLGTFLYTISTMHCMTVSLAQGGEGLGAMWGEETTRAYLQRAGFRFVETHQLDHDIQNNWYVVRK